MFKWLQNKRKNLLIVCAGDNSLHPTWLSPERSYDLITIYYGSNSTVSEKYRQISDLFFECKGLEMELAREILLNRLYIQHKFDFSHYSYIWFPDDDLEFACEQRGIEARFTVAEQTSADVFQPAIRNEHYSVMWEPTREISEAYAHRTNIVELMAHGFRGEVFEKCYLGAIHTCEFMKSGWGLEPIWTKIGEVLFRGPLRTYVFDCIPIIHTRPIGSGDSIVHKLGCYEATYMPQIHTNRMTTFNVYSNLEELKYDSDSELNSNYKHVEAHHRKEFSNRPVNPILNSSLQI